MKKDKWIVVTRNSEEDWVVVKSIAGTREQIVDYVKSQSFQVASNDFTNVKSFEFGETNEDEIYSASVDFKDYRMHLSAVKDTTEEAPEELQCLAFANDASIKVIATFENAKDMGETLYSYYVKGNEENTEGKLAICTADGYRLVTVNGKILLLEDV